VDFQQSKAVDILGLVVEGMESLPVVVDTQDFVEDMDMDLHSQI